MHDDLVYCSYVGFGHYDLWNAVIRVWKATSIMPTMTVERAYRTFMESRDDQVFRDLEKSSVPASEPVGADIRDLLTFTRQSCQQVESGSLPAAEAAARIFGRVQHSAFLPAPFELGAPDNRCFEATPTLIQQAVEWGRTRAPEHVSRLFG